ncbi:hypothetical protein [Massilia sp. TS11]|uniref:FFLEELY motif protein n=1 Tax=Massilia sp. TS11 TaxID=2908003 RepID=UPI001EDBD5AE|nr:hypothetical protein [Massilia sp. TS11]MCG2584427.1 hypothetical protein [Massilia sp. TS11]
MKKQELLATLARELQAVKAERLAARQAPALLAARTALKDYQAARLARTHADLLADPDTQGAALFFLEELYGSHDLCQRDADLERVIPTMQRLLPTEALAAITDAIVLDALSEKLDTAMARALGPRFVEADYIAAYRKVCTPAERARQLALVAALGEALCQLVRIPLLSGTLKLMRKPAELAGLGQLQQFLERGFSSFRAMRRPADFVQTVVQRERALMDAYFSGSVSASGPPPHAGY